MIIDLLSLIITIMRLNTFILVSYSIQQLKLYLHLLIRPISLAQLGIGSSDQPTTDQQIKSNE